ncbi:transglycosylase SLT domain-containing protein [candidate division KSB1 bacterium]
MKSESFTKHLLQAGFLVFFTVCVLIFFCSEGAAQVIPHIDSGKWSDKYDVHFAKYSKRFFGPGFDWKWFKSQAAAESGLRSNAESWAGAKGIMQIVPGTFAEIQEKNPTFTNIGEPRWNIAAGIYYNRQQYRRWSDISAVDERRKFMFASYNAGRGTILNAQRVSMQEGFQGVSWREIETIAPKVPRWRHEETLNYIRRIHTLMNVK